MTLDEVRRITDPIQRAREAVRVEEYFEAQVAAARALRDVAIHEVRTLQNDKGKPNSIRQIAELVGMSKSLIAQVLE